MFHFLRYIYFKILWYNNLIYSANVTLNFDLLTFFPCRIGSGKIVFSWGQALVRTQCSGPFRNRSYSPPLAWSTRGFSSDIHCKYLVEFLEVKVTKVRGFSCPSLPGDFNSQSVHREPPAICQLHLRFFFSSTGFRRGFCSGKLWLPVLAHPPLQFWCSALPCNLIFLKDLRGVDFSICSLFGKEW